VIARGAERSTKLAARAKWCRLHAHVGPVSRSLRAGASVPYEREATYPSPGESKRRRWSVFWLGFKNPGFARLMSVVYILLAATSLAAVGAGRGSLVATAERGNWFDYLAAALGGATIVVAFVLVLALALYADAGLFPFKVLVGALHAALHLAALEGALWLLLELFEPGVASFWPFAAGLLLTAALGFLIGPVIFAAVVLAVSVARGAEARKHANEVFASQAITNWKNFLRLHVGPDGTLTIYPLGVARACEEWDAYPRSAEHRPPALRPTPRTAPSRADRGADRASPVCSPAVPDSRRTSR
jgi:hypothetical protein